MKKVFRVEELDCAHCAAKMEDAIRRVEGVSSATVNFLTQKVAVELEDQGADQILKQIVRACKKIEPDCEIIF